MKIWIHADGRQQGPYDLDQLARMPLTATTPVWYEGLPQWMDAAQAPATAHLFTGGEGPQAAAGFGAAVPPQMIPPKPPTYIGWSILLTVLCCFSPTAIIAIVTGAMSSTRYNHGDYTGARRMSNITEWLVILTIVLGIFTVPFGWVMLL